MSVKDGLELEREERALRQDLDKLLGESDKSKFLSLSLQYESLVAKMKVAPVDRLVLRRSEQCLGRYARERRRLKFAQEKLQQRKKLFDGSSIELGSGVAEQLLRERAAISRSISATAGILEQGNAIKASLFKDRSGIDRSSSGLSSISNQLPGLSTITKRIRNKKTRDNTIVSIVAAMCIILLILYSIR